MALRWRLAALLAGAPVACSDSAWRPASPGHDAGGSADAESPADAGADAAAGPLVDVAASAGLPQQGGVCLGFDDFDADGRPDLVMTTAIATASPAIALYRNDGSGHFEARPVPFTPPVAMLTCAFADVDGDGFLDFVLSLNNRLEVDYFHNEGGGNFSHAATLTPNTPGATMYTGLAFADFDADGRPDLFLAGSSNTPSVAERDCQQTPDGYACFLANTPCLPPPMVLPNTGSGFGAAVPIIRGAACGPAYPNAVAIVDWNADGRPDVFIANDWGSNRLYLNEGDLTFTDVLSSLPVKSYNHGMGAAFEDYDRDGTPDFYVTDLGVDQLYLGVDGGSVAKRGTDWGLVPATQFHSGWAPLAEDFDSDGYTDLFVVNSALVKSYDELRTIALYQQVENRQQYDVLLVNQNAHGFTPVWIPQTGIVSPSIVGGATAVADYDGDGRLDIAEDVGAPPRFQLLHNVGASQHWIEVRLADKPPNVDALGAVVTVASGGATASRLVQRSRGSIGHSWSTLHFGLGANASVDHVDVTWPDGAKQTVALPPTDRVLRIARP